MAGVEIPADNDTGAGSQVTVERIADPAGALVLKVSGELDLSSVASLRAQVEESLEERPGKVVFEFSALRFMDSSGIAFLLTVAERVNLVELRNPTPMLRRLIELSGLTTTLRMTP